MNITQTERAESGPRLRRADHAGGAYDADIAECRKVITERVGLHYVAHVTSGIFDFALEIPSGWPRGRDTAGASDRAGRQLSLAVAELNSACQSLDSGALIRVVVQGENGALFQVFKVASQSFFGLTLDGAPEAVDSADRQLATLAESAARRIGAASLRWGDFRNREDSGELWLPYQAGSPTRALDPPYAAAGREGPVTGPVARACLDALHRNDLHYVGIFRRGQPAWRVDIFDDAALTPFFQRVTPWSRRRGYDQLIGQVNQQVRRFRQLLTLVSSNYLVRLVLDVARGAIYVLPLNGDEYLVGVTLVQSEVRQADLKMRELHESVRAAMARGSRRVS